ncbi:NAD(P)-binding oxidoreductase [Streptomyces sp. NPDC059477]|uniref:NAD(P)-binding oxidoreductase n=1 Tax=Streptomyces sp. NPDC059477 TaxID=3346847 RepID=UPI00368F0181
MFMKVFQIGAAGGVGRRLAALLAARRDEVTGMHRAPAQAGPIRAAGATPVPGDLVRDPVEDLAAKLAGQDAVVFSAGAHGTGREQTTLIDGKGLEKAVEATELAGVRRFVLVSVFPDALRDGPRNDGFEHYIKVKKSADVRLTRTGLDWLIVRPGTLVDTPGTGLVTAGPAVEYGDVPRDDVAAFIAAALHEPLLNRAIVELTTGDTPVGEAIAALV